MTNSPPPLETLQDRFPDYFREGNEGMAQLSQLTGIPIEDLNRLTVLEAERLAGELNNAVFEIAATNDDVRRMVSARLEATVRDIRTRR